MKHVQIVVIEILNNDFQWIYVNKQMFTVLSLKINATLFPYI